MAYDLVAKLRVIDNYSAPMKKAMNVTTSFSSKIAGATSLLTGLAAGLGAVKIATSTFSKGLNFEAQMSSIKALTGATKTQMDQMDELALTMGAKTAFSATQAASAIEELLLSGITPATVQAGALEAALNLATAGGIGLTDAATVMSTSLNAFKRDGLTASDVADVLAGTAAASATGVSELQQSLSSVAAVSAGVHMSFRDTNAALGLLANNALIGSDAGTSLKTMLLNLRPTTKDQITLFRRLGITTKDGGNKFISAAGDVASFDKIAGTLHDSLKGLTTMQRQAMLEVMFGTDAIRAATIFYDEGATGVKDFYEEMSKTTALQVATTKMDNAAGSIEQFKGALETLQIKVLKPLLPAIKTAFDGMGNFIDSRTPQIVAAVQHMTDDVSNYIKKHFINNPDFAKLPTGMSKFTFVIEDFKTTFDTWYKASGEAQVSGAISSLVGYTTDAFAASAPKLLAVGADMGMSLANGIAEGLQKKLADNPLLAMFTGAVIGGKKGGLWGAGVGFAAGFGASAVSSYNETQDNKGKPYVPSDENQKFLNSIWINEPRKIFEDGYDKYKKALDDRTSWLDTSVKTFFSNKPSFGPPVPATGNAGGLDRVPYNGYSARLHKNEKVLTAAEADIDRSNRSGSGKGSGVTINMHGPVNVRKESDIEAIAMKLADLIGTAKGARSIG